MPHPGCLPPVLHGLLAGLFGYLAVSSAGAFEELEQYVMAYATEPNCKGVSVGLFDILAVSFAEAFEWFLEQLKF